MKIRGIILGGAATALAIASSSASLAQILSPSSIASTTGGDSTQKNDSTTAAAALGQAPSAVQGCMKETRILFGLFQWADYSDKCALYTAALAAEQRGDVYRSNVFFEQAERVGLR